MKCFVPALTYTLATTLLLAVDALSIQSSDITASSAGGKESLEKSWTVSSAKQLEKLVVQIPGNVFVDYDPSLKSSSGASDVVAKIVVSGDSKALIDVFDVVPRHSHQSKVSEDSFKVHLKNEDAIVKGYVLTQIFVSDLKMLRDVSAASTQDFIVGEDVLVSDDSTAKVKLSTAGSGGFFFTSKEKFAVESLKISTAGTGDVQFQVASLQVSDDIKLSLAGSGDIAVLANEIQAGELKSSTAGDGDAFVQTGNLHVSKLESSVAGSGSVTLSKNGSCIKQDISVMGSGSVAAGSITCQETAVSLAGEGEVTVQSTDTLKVSSMFSGSVKYVNARPKEVKTSAFFSHGDLVKPATSNNFETYKVVELPSRAPVLLDLKLRERYNLEDPELHVVSNEVTGAAGSMTSLAASFSPTSASGSSALAVVGVAGVALATVGALIRKHSQRKSREEYAPLV